MDRHMFLSRVASRLGLSSPEEAAPIARAVLSALGEGLSRPVAETVGADLPGLLGDALQGAAHGGALELARFHASISSRTHQPAPRAAEEALVVCQTLAEALRPEMARLLREDLPGPVGALLQWPEPEAPYEVSRPDPEKHTLAEGRPGARRPLASARPDRAQTESVVGAANPHADTKLSSAAGLTQEREHRTLAEGRPGSEHPLSTGRPRTS